MRRYRVEKVRRETHDVRTIYFAHDDGTRPDYEAGQYITVLFPELGVPEGKAYSLSSSPGEDLLSITVKTIGPYSDRLCELEPGDIFLGSHPYGDLYADDGAPLICIAAGVGISPLWSVIKSVLAADPGRTITLLYSNKTLNDIVFAEELNGLGARHAGLRVIHHLTREQSSASECTYGRIDRGAIAAVHDPAAQYLLCGSVAFVRAMYGLLRQLDIDDAQIGSEIFFETTVGAGHGSHA